MALLIDEAFALIISGKLPLLIMIILCVIVKTILRSLGGMKGSSKTGIGNQVTAILSWNIFYSEFPHYSLLLQVRNRITTDVPPIRKVDIQLYLIFDHLCEFQESYCRYRFFFQNCIKYWNSNKTINDCSVYQGFGINTDKVVE